MAKFDWGFSIENKATAERDCVLIVMDNRNGKVAHYALDGYTGDGDWGNCIYVESGFREADCDTALQTWGWI